MRKLGVGALAVGAASAAVVAALYVCVRCGERETVRLPADALVVLGAQVHRNGRPSAALRGRVQRAVVLYHAGLAPRLVVTGGIGEAGIAEASVMQGLAVAGGVPEAALVLEARATRTLESARAIGAIGRRAGWRSVIVVSDPFHLWRTMLMFLAEGFSVQTAATDDRYYTTRSRRFYRGREVTSLLMHTVTGEIPLRAWRRAVVQRRSTR
ncbi:MAG: YdcF family protein [Thermomicrobiales bacterium]